MIIFPNAKINLGLLITQKREDGFHNISSCFYPVNWTDILEVLPAKETKFTSSGLQIPEDGQDNLCLRAYKLLKQDFDLAPVHIHLHKVIPIGAGLGGGSADASFTLKTLNTLFSLNLTNQDLENYARQLGSDCAFFIENTAKYCFEKGDMFEKISLDLKDFHTVLVFPKIHISTAEAYQNIKPRKSPIDLKSFLENENIENWKNKIKNDFEESLFLKYPILQEIKTELYEKYGAKYASMTGSGSTMYAFFEEKPILEESFIEKYLVWQND